MYIIYMHLYLERDFFLNTFTAKTSGSWNLKYGLEIALTKKKGFGVL